MRREQSRRDDRDQKPGDGADADDPHRFAEDQSANVARRRAERDADADVARLLPHGRRHQAVETDRRDEQRDETKGREQQRAQSRLRERAIEQLVHRLRYPRSMISDSTSRVARRNAGSIAASGCVVRTAM